MGVLDRNTAFAVADPSLTSAWIVRVPFVSSQIEVVAEQVTATVYKVPAQARFTQGSNQYYPGTGDIDGLSITFYETHDLKVSTWLNAWKTLVFDPSNGVYGVPATYKKPILVEMYSQFQQSPIKRLTYSGCWPTDQGPYELSYAEETGRTTIQAQFSVDSISTT